MGASETVTLTPGLTVTLDALRLGWNLEARGFTLQPAPDGRLQVQPHQRLTPEDVTAIRAHRDELLVLVKMVERIQ